MPIKDKEKRRAYQRELMRQKRANLKMLDPNLNVSPKKKLLDPVRPVENVSPCLRCPEIENSISNFANLYYQEQDRVKEQKQVNYQLEKKIKELELKIISLQETNQILRKDLDYWQNPTSPYEKSWKEKYLELERKTDERLKELDQTILRLKGKLREKDNKNKEWEQKYRSLKKDRQK